MSREIKFRAWDEDYGQWLYNTNGYEYFLDQKGRLYFIDTDDGKIRRYPNSNVVVFSTGIKDKSGVEIYEGDILDDAADEPWRYEVLFDRDNSQFVARCRVAGGITIKDGPSHFYKDTLKQFEVIGNIYENPELLEEQTNATA